MQSTQQVDILSELDLAIDRAGWNKRMLASALHVTNSAVTNWFGRRNIPIEMLQASVKVLRDDRLAYAAAEYSYGVRVFSDKKVDDSPYARYFSQTKEENDRKKLDPEFTLLMGKRKEDRTELDRKKVINYVRELDEEIEEETSFRASIMENWDLNA